MRTTGTLSDVYRKCRRCGARSLLFRIFPTSDGGELRSFECTTCQRVDVYQIPGPPCDEATPDDADLATRPAASDEAPPNRRG